MKIDWGDAAADRIDGLGVYALQFMLKITGFYDAELDGKFGPNTLKAFQSYCAFKNTAPCDEAYWSDFKDLFNTWITDVRAENE